MKSLDAPLCLILKLKEVIDSERQEKGTYAGNYAADS